MTRIFKKSKKRISEMWRQSDSLRVKIPASIRAPLRQASPSKMSLAKQGFRPRCRTHPKTAAASVSSAVKSEFPEVFSPNFRKTRSIVPQSASKCRTSGHPSWRSPPRVSHAHKTSQDAIERAKNAPLSPCVKSL